MAWTTPKTWTPLEKITAADMNKQISGNAQYLYTNKMNATVTQSAPTRALATPYTVTSGKLVHVMVTLLNEDSMVCKVTVDSYEYLTVSRDDTAAVYIPVSFTVGYGQVYQLDITGLGSVYKWVETVIGA
jgi:hypothetical protein